MAIFLAAGMLGSMLCQYPLLLVVNHFGPREAMLLMFTIASIVSILNWIYLHPPTPTHAQVQQYQGTWLQMCKDIGLNLRNWCDVLMTVLLDTPGSIVGTLWGIVMLADFFHFDASTSSFIVMTMFVGFFIGLPTWGHIADKKNAPTWIITLCSGASFLLKFALFPLQRSHDAWAVAFIFFALGFFTSCQTLGFTWVTQNMKSELVGRNSAFNSVIFMGLLKITSLGKYSPYFLLK
jgi:nitrate/nitrite transporter NarK